MQYYKLFYTDRLLPAGEVPDFSMTIPLKFVTQDEALNEAFKLIFGGATVWIIEAPDGSRLERPEIERRYAIFRRA